MVTSNDIKITINYINSVVQTSSGDCFMFKSQLNFIQIDYFKIYLNKNTLKMHDY